MANSVNQKRFTHLMSSLIYCKKKSLLIPYSFQNQHYKQQLTLITEFTLLALELVMENELELEIQSELEL